MSCPCARILYVPSSPTQCADFTCTFDSLPPACTIKSNGSLSPQGLATPNPRLTALATNAASAISPRRFPVNRAIPPLSRRSAEANKSPTSTEANKSPTTTPKLITIHSSIFELHHSRNPVIGKNCHPEQKFVIPSEAEGSAFLPATLPRHKKPPRTIQPEEAP